MKKFNSTIAMLAMMVAALSFTACGGDDEVDNGGDASIVGMWECTYFDFDSDLPGMNADSNMQIGDRISFESSGKYHADYKSGDIEIGRWNLKANKLTIVADGDISIPMEYTVTKLTSTELEITLDIKFMKLLYRCKRIS